MVRVKKARVHNEWFGVRALKKCPECGYKVNPNVYGDENVWSWCEYVRAKKRRIRYICPNCVHEIKPMLLTHADPCGCRFSFQIFTNTLHDKVRLALLEIEKEVNGYVINKSQQSV